MAVTMKKVCRKKGCYIATEQRLVWESESLEITKENAGFKWLSRSFKTKTPPPTPLEIQIKSDTLGLIGPPPPPPGISNPFFGGVWILFLQLQNAVFVKTLTSHWVANLPDLKTNTLTALSNQRLLASPCIACLQTCHEKKNETSWT